MLCYHNILDEPGEPEDVTVTVIETLGGDEMKNSCVLLLQLKPPSNINADDINHYIIDYQSSQPVTTTDTSKTFVVSNCSRDLRVRVRAVNRCDVSGNSTLARFLPQTGDIGVPDPKRSIDGTFTL